MEQVVMPVLVMIGAGLLVTLAVPVGLLTVSGVYFARRTAIWLLPAGRRYAVDLAARAVDLGGRVVHSRLPRTLAAGAAGCALPVPSLATPVRDLNFDRGAVSLAEPARAAAAQLGSCCAVPVPKPAQSPANQKSTKPVLTGDGDGVATQTSPAGECVARCDQSWQQDLPHSTSKGKKKKKSKA